MHGVSDVAQLRREAAALVLCVRFSGEANAEQLSNVDRDRCHVRVQLRESGCDASCKSAADLFDVFVA